MSAQALTAGRFVALLALSLARARACSTVERDVLPMCRAYNIGFVPWGVLGQGKVRPESTPCCVPRAVRAARAPVLTRPTSHTQLTGKVARGMPLDEAASRCASRR